MVQARLFRKHNPDLHFCNAIYNFMKERVMAHRDTSTLFSVDAKSKVSVGEPDFPTASVTRGKKVIVGIKSVITILVRYQLFLTLCLYKKFPRIKSRVTKVFKVHGFLVSYFTHLKTW